MALLKFLTFGLCGLILGVALQSSPLEQLTNSLTPVGEIGYSSPMTFSPYAAGRKVYSNGSYAPTRGRVNPKGYIKRELRKGKMAQSQSRSGLAQAALKNLQGRVTKFPGGKPMLNPPRKNPSLPGGKPAPAIRSTQGRMPGGKPMLGQPMRGQVGKISGGKPRKPSLPGGRPVPLGAGSNTSVQAEMPGAAPTPSYVQINANGQLDLPYSEGLSWDTLQGQQDMNRQLLEIQMQQQQQGQEYSQAKRQGEMDYQNLARQTLSGNSSRGLAFSSAHANDVAQNATAYNNHMTDLDSRNTQYNQGVGAQRTQIEAAFNDMIRQGALQHAQSLAGEAGTLGYGRAVPTPNMVPKMPKPPVKKIVKKKNKKGGFR